MPTSCVAFGCNNIGKIVGITYHSFPKDAERRQQWINAVKRKAWEPKSHSRICSSHFREVDIDRTSLSCVRIRDGAVPAIFPAFNQVKDRKITTKPQPETSPSTSFESPTKKIKIELAKSKSDVLSYRKKVRNLQQNKRRLKKKITNLKAVLDALKKKMNFQQEECLFLTSITKNADCLIKRALDKSVNKKLKKIYDERLKAFAVTLHFLSPKAYLYIRKTFNSALPHPRTLGRWYSSVNAEPGFSQEVFRALKEHTQSVVKECVCSLMLDCMAIRQKLEWDGKRFHGTVNVGNTDVDDDSAPIATEALVFYLVSINSTWKVPLGHFFVTSTKGEQLSGMVKHCLNLLQDANIKVASLTCDGTACNIAMANHLGCSIGDKDLVPWFSHPSTHQRVHFFLDPAHMLKLIRNTLGDGKVLFDKDNNQIEWRHMEQLNELQTNEGLHLGNKLSKNHINFVKQKMKVKLAAQLLSSSVADSLQYLMLNKVAGFESCSATIEFVRTFDRLFDILNSRSIRAKYGKQALYPGNFEKHSKILLEAKEYISSLKDKMGLPILKSKRKTGFLGFIVCIESTLAMYEEYVNGENRPLMYLPVYKISQDHIERLFGYVRSRGGHNNNPSCREFTAAFKRILLHKELHETDTGNSLILNKTLILSIKRQKDELQQINSSTPGWRCLEEEEKAALSQDGTQEEEEDILNILENTSNVACNIVEYIAGYIIRSVKGGLVCCDCLELLTSTDTQKSSLIYCKNRGGLIQPSVSLVKLCLIAESVLKFNLNKGNLTSIKNLTQLMTVSVMKRCIGINLFPGNHFVENEIDECHYVLLIKLVCKKYFKVRLHHFTKKFNESLHSTKLRNHLLKTVIFMGQ